MTDLLDAKPRGFADTSRIDASEAWELDFWSQEFAVTQGELLRAIAKVGDGSDDVERELKRMEALREDRNAVSELPAALPAV